MERGGGGGGGRSALLTVWKMLQKRFVKSISKRDGMSMYLPRETR